MSFPQLRSKLSGNQFKTSSPGSYSLSADSGTFDWSGTQATLTYSSTPAADTSLRVGQLKRQGYPRAFHPSLRKPLKFALPAQAVLTADAGAFVITGSDAALVAPIAKLSVRTKGNRAWPRPFAPSPFGQFRSERGVNIIGYSTVALAYALEVDPGAFTIDGPEAILGHQHRLTASESSYVIGGQVASLLVGRHLSAESGAYAITGTDITFGFGLVLDPGEFFVSGASANLIYSGAPAQATGSMMLLGVG
jgi:hypothetical protein